MASRAAPPVAEADPTASAKTVRLALADRLAGEIDPMAVMRIAAEAVGTHLGVSRCGYGEIESGGDICIIPCDWTDGVPSVVGRHTLLRGSAMVQAYERGEVVVIEDGDALDLPADVRTGLANMQCRALICAPLLLDGRLAGLFSAQNQLPRRWSVQEIDLVVHVARMTWGALQHARTVARLRESEETFRLLADNIPGICWLAGADGRADWMNAAGHAYYGDTGGADGDAAAVVHPDDLPRIDALWAAALERGEPIETMVRVRGADDIYRPLLSRAAPIRDAAGAIVRWCGVQVDLTERHAQDRRHSLLRAFHDATRDIVDEETILATASAIVGEHLAIDEMYFAELVDPSVPSFRVRRADRGMVKGRPEIHAFAGIELVRDAYRRGEPLVVDDCAEPHPMLTSALRATAGARTEGASINVPIVKDSLVVGMLSSQAAAPRRWSRDEIELCQEFADRLWATIARARAETALRERDISQAFLIDWGDALRRVDTPDAIMATTLERLGHHLGIQRVTYSEGDETRRVFTTQWNWCDDCASLVGLRIELDALGPDVEREWLAGEIVRYDDVTADPRVSDVHRSLYAERGIRAFVSIPLIRAGEVRSILSVQTKTTRHWRDVEVALIRDIGERTWVTLERARAQAELRDRDRNQRFLIEWSDRVRNEHSPRAILATTLAMVGTHLGASRANYAEGTPDGEALEVLQEWCEGTLTVIGERFPLAVFGTRVLADHLSGEPVVAVDIAADPRFDATNRPLYESVGVAAFLSVPLVRQGRMEAVLSVQSIAARAWTAAEIELLREVADRTWAVLERAHSEERLADSEALLAAFMDNAPLGMHLKDANGRYLRMNPELSRQIAIPVDAVLGRLPEEFLSPDTARRVEDLERRALAGEVASDEFHFADRTDYTALLAVVFPIHGANGVARTGGFTLDLTARKEAEAALERSRDALYQSEKLTALGSLLAGVSHELNNPLSIVVAQAVMMERQAKGTEVAERAFKIRRAADRCARIVQTFLAMARQKAPERQAVALNAVVEAALELASYGMRTDGIAIVRRLSPALPQIAADADQLHQIIVNLLVNAQHAMGAMAGERMITLSTARGAEPHTVVLDVADTGPGMPEDVARRIFEPFYTTKAQGEGTGLGLSFSQGLAEAHGGRLTLMPSERGARFRLTLPIEADHVLTRVPADKPGAAQSAQRRALLIDDEPEIAEALADFLALDGIQADIAGSGDDACRMVLARDYDLIVSDLRMPGMDGPAFHAWLTREQPGLLDRIGFVTGDTLGVAVARFLAEVGRPVLEKPFSPETVHVFVCELDTGR